MIPKESQGGEEKAFTISFHDFTKGFAVPLAGSFEAGAFRRKIVTRSLGQRWASRALR
jgi:hypothetical protein